jgi:proteic killer suppression protein
MVRIEDLWAMPSLKVKRFRKGWSIRINNQWRICFHWDAETKAVSSVEITDYH